MTKTTVRPVRQVVTTDNDAGISALRACYVLFIEYFSKISEFKISPEVSENKDINTSNILQNLYNVPYTALKDYDNENTSIILQILFYRKDLTLRLP